VFKNLKAKHYIVQVGQATPIVRNDSDLSVYEIVGLKAFGGKSKDLALRHIVIVEVEAILDQIERIIARTVAKH
jgi:hypothetical protein